MVISMTCGKKTDFQAFGDFVLSKSSPRQNMFQIAGSLKTAYLTR